MSLRARIIVRDRGVDACLDVPSGRTLALLGPNGSGKSTILAAIAGTVRADAGEATLDGRILHAMDASGTTWLTPQARRVGLVTQHSDLFPAMTVLDNVAYGIRARGARRAEAHDEARAWLARVGLGHAALDKPRTLSAGQARRVTIARALAARPDAVLLDEPFSGVDVEAAAVLRALVSDVAADVTTVLTTHDVLDAHLLSDVVAVLDGGHVIETGGSSEVLVRPRTAFAAAMAGLILLHGTAEAGSIVLADGSRVRAHTEGVTEGAPALVAISPLEVDLAHGTEASIADTVVALELRGDTVRVTGAIMSADVPPHRASHLSTGAAVGFALTATPHAYAP